MATYWEWNDAIASSVARRLIRGEALYLSVDEDTLITIGFQTFPEVDARNVVHDFECAIREECVSDGRVYLPPPTSRNEEAPPRCIAFLGAMVLAAHRMAPDDDIAEINYFTRLREILGLVGEGGRPPGLGPPGAPEESLWWAFNNWSMRNEWQPTAEQGPEGAMKYTNYPLSQTLLRQGDKGRLEDEFSAAQDVLGRDSDRERVGGWFFNRANHFTTSHIRRLAQESTTDRFNAIVDAVHAVYMSTDWDRSDSEGATTRHRSGQGRLTAGLYRQTDPIFGTITYHLFPRRQPGAAQLDLEAVRDGERMLLHRDRDGQFRPLWPIDPSGGESYEILGDPQITELYLPARDFWILTRDQFDESSGTYASRGTPRLGETFLLLCRKECKDQLNILRDEALLIWNGDPTEVSGHDQWLEYRECMVLSASWDGIVPQMPNLFDELRPRTRASLSLHGGLKTRQRYTWLEGYMPELSITSFDRAWRVRVTDASSRDEGPLLDETVSSNTAIDLSDIGAGDYWVEVLAGDRSADRRYMRVVSWDSLQPADPGRRFGTPIGGLILRGGLLVDGNGEAGE